MFIETCLGGWVVNICMDYEKVSHTEVIQRYGGDVIPYNFDETAYDGIRCIDCEEVHPEDEWKWVDTIAYDVEDKLNIEIQGVKVKCPNCEYVMTCR